MGERYGPHVLQPLAVGDTVTAAWVACTELQREIRAGLALASGVDDRRVYPATRIRALARDYGLDMVDGHLALAVDSIVDRVRPGGAVVLANGLEFESRILTTGGLLGPYNRERPSPPMPFYTAHHDHHWIAAKRLFYAAIPVTLPPMEPDRLAVFADMLEAVGGAEQAAFLRSLP